MTKHNHRFSTFIGHGESPAQTANEIRRMMDRGEPLPVAQIADLVERHGDEIEGLMDDLSGIRSSTFVLENRIACLEAENKRLAGKVVK